MTSTPRQSSVIASTAFAVAIAGGATLGAQVPAPREVDSVVARAAVALGKEISSLPGQQYFRASVFCNAGPVQFVCDLDRPVSSVRKRELDQVFARGLGPNVRPAPSMEVLLSARAEARRQADAVALRQPTTNPSKPSAGRSREDARIATELKCGAAERWTIIADVLQVSVRTDSVLMTMGVTQIGPVAGCSGGSRIWRLTALRRGEGFTLGPLQRGAHFETAFEVPK